MELCLCSRSAEQVLFDMFGFVPMLKAFEEIDSLDPNSVAGFAQIEELMTRNSLRKTPQARTKAVRDLLAALRTIPVDELTTDQNSELTRKVDRVIRRYGVEVSDVVTPVLKDGSIKTAKRVRDVWNQSLYENPDNAPAFLVRDRKAINSVLDNNKIFIRGEYDRNVSRSTSKLIAQDYEQTGGSVASLVDRMRTELPGYFAAHDQNYLEIVSGVQLNTHRSFSQMRTLEDAGVEKFEVVAVGDRRTTPFCLSIDGMTFRVDQGLSVFRRASKAKSLPQLKSIRPMVRQVGKGPNMKFKFGDDSTEYDPNDITEELLSQFGTVYPPYHMRCRTTIVGVF